MKDPMFVYPQPKMRLCDIGLTGFAGEAEPSSTSY